MVFSPFLNNGIFLSPYILEIHTEKCMDIYKIEANGNLLHDSGNSGLGNNLEGGLGRGVRGMFTWEGTWVNLWLTLDVW